MWFYLTGQHAELTFAALGAQTLGFTSETTGRERKEIEAAARGSKEIERRAAASAGNRTLKIGERLARTKKERD